MVLKKDSFEVIHEFSSPDLTSVSKEGEKVVLVTKEKNEKPKISLDVIKRDDCLKELRRVFRQFQENYQVGIWSTAQ